MVTVDTLKLDYKMFLRVAGCLNSECHYTFIVVIAAILLVANVSAEKVGNV